MSEVIERQSVASTNGKAVPAVEVRDLRKEFSRRDKKATSAGLPGILLEAVGRGRIEVGIGEDEWLEAAARARIG